VKKTGSAVQLAAAVVAAAMPLRGTAADLLPPSAADLIGARGLGLAAYRGLASGNDGMFTNAAALAAYRRYAVEFQFLQERLTGARQWQSFQGSIVDSETTAFTGGFAYTRVTNGVATGNLFHVPLAAAIGNGLYGGITGKYMKLKSDAAGSFEVATADASLYWQASSMVGFGVAGYNLVPVGDRPDAPQSMGAGLSIGDQRRFNLAGDWRGDYQRRGKLTSAWSAGAELLAADAMPVRAGFVKDGVRGGSFWSVGLGYVSSGGMAFDIGYRQGFDAAQDRTFAAGVKFFMRQQ
jgi:hypothetical protein